MRHDDALRSRIEQARGVVMFLAGHAYQRGNADGEGGRGDHRGVADIECRVLHVDEQSVVAAGFGDGADVGGARLVQTHANSDLAGFELLLGVVRINFHMISFGVLCASGGRRCRDGFF